MKKARESQLLMRVKKEEMRAASKPAEKKEEMRVASKPVEEEEVEKTTVQPVRTEVKAGEKRGGEGAVSGMIL